jgi:hypothetical protein
VIGFSTADKIVFGQEAFMHLHIVNPDLRQIGYGTKCVEETVKSILRPSSCNGFSASRMRSISGRTELFSARVSKYVKTHQTVPGSLNYHQAVIRWGLYKD